MCFCTFSYICVVQKARKIQSNFSGNSTLKSAMATDVMLIAVALPLFD